MWGVVLTVFLLIGSINADEFDEACVENDSNIPVEGKFKLIDVEQEKRILLSPGFDKRTNYPNNAQCSYILRAPFGMHVRIHFNSLDIETTKGCEGDSVRIIDFDAKGSGYMVKVFCDSSSPNDFVSDSNGFQIMLKTDDYGNRRGFNITYYLQANRNLCGQGQLQCRNRKCVDEKTECDGRDDCQDGTDEENCSGLVNPGTCGKPEIQPEVAPDFDRIVGGREAVPGSWPFMVSLQDDLVEPNSHTCGGSLINSQWVLTACHCFEKPARMRKPGGWRVHLGKHRKYFRDEYEQIRYVTRIIIFNDTNSEIFERYGRFDLTNDIALIKLNAPVKFTKYVQPACLPEGNTELNSQSKCFGIGWGQTRGSGGSDVLKQSLYPVQEDLKCQNILGNGFHPLTMICAGSLSPLNGVCHGDSGGPLICEINNQWTAMGVASFVTQTNTQEGICGIKDRPAVYNKVAPKVKYISKMISKYSSTD